MSSDFFFDGHLALDLLNTVAPVDGRPADLLDSPAAAAAWLARSGAAPDDALVILEASPPEARRLLEEMHRLREAVASLVDAWARGTILPEAAIFALNRVLATRHREARVMADGVRACLREQDRLDLPMGALASVAETAAMLLATGDRQRLRRCDDPGCGLWFYDTSRNGRRRWCSMARCGNRAKVAAHYRRVRA